MRWNFRSPSTPTVALALALAFATPASAAAQFVTFDDQALFLAAITNPGLDTFNDVSLDGATTSPLFRTAGAYGYTASVTADEDFFGVGSPADRWLSTNTATDAITFSGFTGGVGALGGNFFASDVAGAFAIGNIVVTYVDAAGAQSTTLVGPGSARFFGVVSLSRSLTTFTVRSVQPTSEFLWPTVNDLRLGQTTVPEPGTVALLASGLLAIGIVVRRRRA